MNLGVEFDERFWAYVPARFPHGGFATAAEWAGSVVVRNDSVQASPDARTALAARRVAEAALEAVTPADLFGLLFWPAPDAMAVLFHVEIAAPLPAGVDPVDLVVAGLPVAVPPSVERIEIPGFGDGVAVRFVLPAEPGHSPVAGLGYVVSGPRFAVRVTSEPTTTTLVGLADAPLRDILRSMSSAIPIADPIPTHD